MAGQNGNVIAERKYFFSNSFDQKIEITSGQVAASNTAGKENVSADEQLLLARKKAEAARAMPWDFEHLHLQPEKNPACCFLHKKIGRDRFDLQLESETAEKFRIGNHRRGFGVTPDLATEPSFDFRHIGHVVEMTVREQQKFQIDPAAAERFDPGARTIGCVE